jgi:hypothetical protein
MRDMVDTILSTMPEPHVGRVFPVANIRTAFETAVNDLRHTFASWFVMRGGSLQALSEITNGIGWSARGPGHRGATLERQRGGVRG